VEERFRWLTVVAVALFLGFGLWSMRTDLSPLLCGGALLIILWPLRAHALARQLIVVTLALVTIWLLMRARVIVYPTLAALVVAFLLDPIVDRLCARRVPRGVAALAVLLPAGGLLALFLIAFLPLLLTQARALIDRLPGAYAYIAQKAGPLLANWLPEGTVKLPADIGQLLPNAEHILQGIFSGATHLGRGFAAVAKIGSFFLLTPILTYYMLVDFGNLRREVTPYLPERWVENGGKLGVIFQESVAAWLKAQLLVALLVAVIMITGYVAIGLPYALLLGFMAGVLNLVPVLGFWVGAIAAASAGLFTPHPLSMLLKIAVVLVIEQLLESNVLTPRIVGGRLGTKPVVLLVAMLTLSLFFGVIGFLLAAPVIGLVRGIWVLWGPHPRVVRGASGL
jgi:predicted PurR-regulated permease PerM